MSKRRSDISKLVTASRDIWRQSVIYHEKKKELKHKEKRFTFICERCKKDVEVIRIDHIDPIGKQPDKLVEFGVWFEKLFCEKESLQGLCNSCHYEKTKEENQKRKEERKKIRQRIKNN